MAILAIFQKSADWLDWPCPLSAALQKGSQDFFSLLYSNFHSFFLKCEAIVRSSPWSFGHSDLDPSSVPCFNYEHDLLKNDTHN